MNVNMIKHVMEILYTASLIIYFKAFSTSIKSTPLISSLSYKSYIV